MIGAWIALKPNTEQQPEEAIGRSGERVGPDQSVSQRTEAKLTARIHGGPNRAPRK